MAGQEITGLGHASASSSSTLRPLELLLATIEGILLQPPPPLPIRVCPFRFLTELDLTGVGLIVDEVPFNFGWKLKRVEVVKSWSEEFHIRDVGKNFGLEFDVSELEFLLGEGGAEKVGSEETGAGTGLEACFQEASEFVRDAFEDSEETTPEKTLGEEFPKIRRVKTKAGRLDLSTRKRQRTQSSKPTKAKKSKPTEKTTVSPPPRSTRKSIRLALPLSAKKPRKGTFQPPLPEQLEEIVSSPEEIPENTPQEQGSPPVPDAADVNLECTPQEQGPSPVPEEATPKSSTKPAVKRTPKRKATSKKVASSDSEEEYTPTPPTKKAKTSASDVFSPTMAKFLKRHVVRGKFFKVSYFQQQGLEAFIEKVRAQGWFDLFTNTNLRCSVPELAEFYSNCHIEKEVVESRVGGKCIRFDAEKLGTILGVPSTGFDVYVREDKSVLGPDRLLELARSLSQNATLEAPRPIKKGEMTPLNQLIYWFLLKNVIPRGQGRNQVDVMAQCLIDLMDREEQINLPALMIKHIARIANPSREHDLGYGFLLTMVFDSFEVKLTKPAGVTFVDEIGSSTLMGCGFNLVEGAGQEQESRTPCPPVSAGSSIGSTVENLVQAHALLVSEVCTIKSELDAERAETITRYETLLALLRELTSQLPPPPPSAP